MTCPPLRKMAVIFMALTMLPVTWSVTAQTKYDFVDLYEATHPSVVVLSTERTTYTAESVQQQASALRFETSRQVGSGVLIDQQYIITAAHVVHAVDKVVVWFADGHRAEAKIVVTYPDSDLALVKLKQAYSLSLPAKLGDSSKVKIGERIYIIGAPHGVSYTITRGIISGRHAPDTGHGDFQGVELFQTDAAINTGNSGGPMFNMDGEVIGIVSFIKSASGRSEGLGFAISIKSARELLFNKPPVYSGIEYKIVEGLLAKALNVPQPRGLLIQHVGASSLGQRLGVRGGSFEATIENERIMLGGDIVLEIQGVNISDARAAEKIDKVLEHVEPGQQIRALVWRGGKIMELTAPL